LSRPSCLVRYVRDWKEVGRFMCWTFGIETFQFLKILVSNVVQDRRLGLGGARPAILVRTVMVAFDPRRG
jgi:hypothetical protein